MLKWAFFCCSSCFRVRRSFFSYLYFSLICLFIKPKSHLFTLLFSRAHSLISFAKSWHVCSTGQLTLSQRIFVRIWIICHKPISCYPIVFQPKCSIIYLKAFPAKECDGIKRRAWEIQSNPSIITTEWRSFICLLCQNITNFHR